MGDGHENVCEGSMQKILNDLYDAGYTAGYQQALSDMEDATNGKDLEAPVDNRGPATDEPRMGQTDPTGAQDFSHE